MIFFTCSAMNDYNSFFIPNKGDLPLNTGKIRKWYHNLIPEIEKANYPPGKILLLKDKHNYYGKYLSQDTRGFFLNHFGRNLAKAVNYFIFDAKENIKYLEIGSGCGNQLLLMAFLGAETFGCDMRQDVCDLVKIRQDFYETISIRRLNVSLMCNDFFKVNWDSYERFDAVNFLFSFNDLLPAEKVLELVSRLIKPGGKLVIQDTNPTNYYNRLFRKRNTLPPQRIVKILKGYGFKIHSLKGGYVLPPFFWRRMPGNFLTSLDQILCKSIFLSVSYQLMAEK